ncbi:MAG: hypothetical protein GX493_11325 [Firmicutes bacterium]|nr:hypothetical protein [Bacillota bacterium]
MTRDGVYYHSEEKAHPDDIEVPERPTPYHKWDWEAMAWVKGQEEFMRQVRARRNQLLCLTDWTQLPDAPLTEEERAAWREYRQALRDLPSKVAGEDVPWPEPPARPKISGPEELP